MAVQKKSLKSKSAKTEKVGTTKKLQGKLAPMESISLKEVYPPGPCSLPA